MIKRRRHRSKAKARRQAALVIHPDLRVQVKGSRRDPAARLEEATGLARAIDLDVTQAEIVPVKRIRPATFIGAGAVEDFATAAEHVGFDLAIIDCELSPVQQRNLERAWNTKVIDRTALILEIFGERAQTREGALQVELAHLTYQRSRLVRSWTHLERQRGGLGFVGGPGETQIEIDRRLIGERITRIRRDLKTVSRTRGLHRKARKKVPYPVIALVGYTNAGKSTLFNRLTGADVRAQDLLFATLDPTMRRLALPSGREAILSDTVGFISDLPTDLIAAFRATLEEVVEADLIVHVRDVSHPDCEAQKADVVAILHDLRQADDGGNEIEALNKCDRLDGGDAAAVSARCHGHNRSTVMVSALSGQGCDRLLELIDRALGRHRRVVDVTVSTSDGAALAWLYERGNVLDRADEQESIHLRVGLDEEDIQRFENRAGQKRRLQARA